MSMSGSHLEFHPPPPKLQNLVAPLPRKPLRSHRFLAIVTQARSQNTDDQDDHSPTSSEQSIRPKMSQLQSTRRSQTWRLISSCLMGFSNGITDSAPGAILPYIQKDHHLGYDVVSLIFVANALGYLFAAPLSQRLDRTFGRAGAYIVCQALMCVGFLMIVLHPPFPVVVAAFWFIGFGEAFNLALNNVFCASLGDGSTSALGLLHGSYGAGGTVGPFVATSMVVSGLRWSNFYAVNLCCTLFNGLGSAIAFRSFERDQEEKRQGEYASLLPEEEESSGYETVLGTSIDNEPIEESTVYDAIFNKTTLLGATFIFAYQGAEVSISGWMIEFLISYRNGDPALVGYVTVGFWAGISLGRFIVSPLAHKIGERLSVFLFTALCLGLQVLVWFTGSISVNAVAIALVGLLLGPVYPCAVAVYGELLPKHMHLTSLSTISAMGSSGGAVVPLLVGLLAAQFGTVVLHPLCVAMYSIMLLTWVSLPSKEKPETQSAED